MADGQVSIGGALTYTVALWRANARSIWGVLALNALTMTVYMAGFYALNENLMLAGAGALIVVQPILSAAVYRMALADRHPADPAFVHGHSGLQWRAMEWRMLAVALLLTVLFLIFAALGAVLVVGLALGIIMNHGGAAPPKTPEAVLAALGQDGQTAVTVVLAAVLAVLLYFYLRLSLSFAATADKGKLMVLQSWSLTKGRFWALLATLLVVQLPLSLLQMVVAAVAQGGQTSVVVPAQMSAEAAMAAALVIGVAFGAVIAPLSAGVLAYYYRSNNDAPAGGAP